MYVHWIRLFYSNNIKPHNNYKTRKLLLIITTFGIVKAGQKLPAFVILVLYASHSFCEESLSNMTVVSFPDPAMFAAKVKCMFHTMHVHS